MAVSKGRGKPEVVSRVRPPGVVRFGSVEIANAELKQLDDDGLVDRLLAGGMSRLSAARVVAIERGDAEPSRARIRSQARPPAFYSQARPLT